MANVKRKAPKKTLQKFSTFTMLAMTVFQPLTTAVNVMAEEVDKVVDSKATNLKEAQGTSDANQKALAKTGEVSGRATEVNVPKTQLTDAIEKYKGNVTLEEGDSVDWGTILQSDTGSLNNAIAGITADYDKQASTIKALSDKYEADLKFYNENKSKVNDLVSELNKAVKSAQDLGAKVDSNGVVTGKSFAEIQDALAKQIADMKALAEKQAQNNADFASATAEYNQKSAEITALEKQLDTLVQQGQALGSRITLDTVEDGKTLDEIKTLLNQQITTISDLVKKQEALNKQYDADLATYNTGVADTTKLAQSLATQVSALQNTAGVTVKQGETITGKSWAEIKAGLEAKIKEAQALKAKQDTTAKADETAQASYLKAVEEYNKKQTEYEKALAEYNTAKAQYDKDLATYNTKKAQYDKDKQAYDQAMARAEANKGVAGNLSKVIGQSLVFKSEPNAKVSISGQTANLKTNDGLKMYNADNLTNDSYSANLEVSQNILENASSGYGVVMEKGKTTTVTYEGLTNSTYNGKKISKVVYKYTPQTVASQNNKMIAYIFQDPTDTIRVGSQMNIQKENAVKMDVEFYYEDGSRVNFSNENPAIVSFSSLNAADNADPSKLTGNVDNTSVYREFVKDMVGIEFVKISGSYVDEHNGVIYSDKNIDGFGYNDIQGDEWDKNGNPKEYIGAGAGVLSGETISFVFGNTNSFSQWFSFNSSVKAEAIPTPPVEPTPPIEPTKPTPPTPPETPQTQTENVTFTYNLYELPTAPVPTTLTGSYSEFVRPDTPNKKIETGIYTEFTTPEKPTKPTFTYHLNTLASIQDGVKQVKNSDETDINNQVVPKGSTGFYDLTISQLPAHRATSKVLTFTDPFSAGFNFDLEATQKDEKNKGKWDITYDKETNTATVTITKEYLAELNKDRTKAFDVSAPRMVGTFTNDSAVYENDFTVNHNDNTFTSNIVTVTTPTPPTITTDENGNKEENPLKTVKDSKGNDINGMNVHPESNFVFDLTWSNVNYKGIKVSKEAIEKGFFYAEDIPEDAVTPLLDQLTVTVKGTDEVVEGIKAEYYESLDKAPENVQKQYKEEGISPNGGFVHIYVTDEFEQAHNDKYKVTGTDLEIKLPVQAKKGFTGQFQNTAYQSDWGNGYQTNTTTNNVPTHEATKYLVTGDTVDINKLSDTEGTVTNRKSNYNWVVKNVLDEYTVKHGLYKTLSLDDSDFADVQTADQVQLLNSKGEDVTSEVDIQVWVDGKLYSVNGNLSNEAIASLGLQDVANGKLVGDLTTNGTELASKDKNILFPDELNEDGKKANVEIKAVFKDPSKVSDTTFYTVYKNVNTKTASTGEIKNYLDGSENLVIENKARISYSFQYDDEESKTKKTTAKVNVPIKSPKNQSAKKFVQVGDVDVTKLTDKDTVTDLPSRTTPYNWIVEASLDKDAVASGTYQSLTINDDSFADLQKVTKATVRTANNKDVTGLVDIQVWKDGKLYSVNGKAVGTTDETTTEATTAETTTDTATANGAVEVSNNVLLPEGLDTDGKKDSVKIKAVFKDSSLVDAEKYYLVLHDVTYSGANATELQHYLNKDRLVVDNVANLEYQGIFDESPKKTDDTKAETKTPVADPTAKATKYVQAGKLDVSKLTDKDKATTLSKLTDSYNWIIKAELNEDAVKAGNYTDLAITDSEFADVQTVTDAKLLTKDNKDVSDLVDFKVYVDGKLYSVNGTEVKTAEASATTEQATSESTTAETATEATTTEVKVAESATASDTAKSKILLPEGLDEDGKKGSVKIVAEFKDPSKVSANEYYFALTDVTYNQASKDELKLYAKDSSIAIENVANVEYKGIFDKDIKTTPDVKSDVTTPTPETTAKTTKYVKVGDVDVTKLTDSDISTDLAKDVASYNWIVKTELSKEAVDGGMYDALTISDSKFADIQTVKGAEVKNSKGEDVTNLVDIQVWKDGKLYSVNGKVADRTTVANDTASSSTATSSSTTSDSSTTTASSTEASANVGNGSGFNNGTTKEEVLKIYAQDLIDTLVKHGADATVNAQTVEAQAVTVTKRHASALKNIGAGDFTATDIKQFLALGREGFVEYINKSSLTDEQKKVLISALDEMLTATIATDTSTSSSTTASSSTATSTSQSATSTSSSASTTGTATQTATANNVALPEGLNKDGKQGSVEIKAVFKDGSEIKDDTYYLVLKDVSFADASTEELAQYTSNSRVTIENLAKAEYKGIFDDKAKESNEAEADVKRVNENATPVDKAKQTVEDVAKATEKFANTGMGKATGIGAILATLGLTGLWFWKKKKDELNADTE